MGRPLSVSLGLRVGLVIAIAEFYYDHSSPADALAPLAFFGIAWAVGDKSAPGGPTWPRSRLGQHDSSENARSTPPGLRRRSGHESPASSTT